MTPKSAQEVARDPDSKAPSPPKNEKLQKVLARTGLGSRREMERWIEDGRVTVDGRPATLGDRVGHKARIAIDGKPLSAAPAEETRCILYHKPTGEVCSRKDPQGRRRPNRRPRHKALPCAPNGARASRRVSSDATACANSVGWSR